MRHDWGIVQNPLTPHAMHPSDIMPFLSDDELLLALDVCKERLADPARWCREARALNQAVMAGPKTVWLVEILFEWARRLWEEASGEQTPPRSSFPISD